MDSVNEDQGPGWIPAIVAEMALMGIIGFFVCAFATWSLFQKRTELAIRTLQGDYVGQLEQSLLDPATKTSLMREVEMLIADLERGKYENWQSAAIMQRLQRLPVFQWGELQAIEAFLNNSSDKDLSEDDRRNAIKEFSRLRRGVEIGKVTSFDFEEILEPVRRPSAVARGGHELARPLAPKSVLESASRAKRLADRSDVPDEAFQDVRIESLFRREVELGASQGGF